MAKKDKPPKDGGGAGGKKKPPKESSPGLSVPDPSRETLREGGRRRDTDDATSKKKLRFQGEGAIRVGLNVPQPSRNGLNFPPVD